MEEELFPMVTTTPIKDLRSNLREYYQSAEQGFEIIVEDAKAKNRSRISIISTQLLEELLAVYSFHPEIFFDEESGTWNVHINELGLYAYHEDKEQAREDMVDLVVDYTTDYLNRLQLFLHVPDRRKHYPYIIRLSHCSGREEVKKVLQLDGNL